MCPVKEESSPLFHLNKSLQLKLVELYFKHSLVRERFIEKKEEKTDKCQFCPYTYLRTVKTDMFPFFPLVKTKFFLFFPPSPYTYLPKTDICKFFSSFFSMNLSLMNYAQGGLIGSI